VNTWQPINTAPNAEFVLITDGESIEVGRYIGGGWLSSDGLDFGYGEWDGKLTHWMPLPLLPKQDK